MIADILLIVFALLYLAVASIFDLKTQEIPDWLNFSLIAIALGIRLIHALVTSEWMYFVWGIVGFGALFVVGCAIYYTKQWGGGDTKLAMALGAVFATTPYFIKSDLPFLVVLFTNILIIGAIYGFVWVVVLAIKNYKKVGKEMLLHINKYRRVRFPLLVLALIMAIVSFLLQQSYLRILFIMMAIALFILLYLVVFVKAVEKIVMFKKIKPNELVEGDWVAEEIKVKGKVICSSKDLGVTKKQINQLIKAKVKKILIKEGIPFVPSFFLATLFTLIVGKIIILLII